MLIQTSDKNLLYENIVCLSKNVANVRDNWILIYIIHFISNNWNSVVISKHLKIAQRSVCVESFAPETITLHYIWLKTNSFYFYFSICIIFVEFRLLLWWRTVLLRWPNWSSQRQWKSKSISISISDISAAMQLY